MKLSLKAHYLEIKGNGLCNVPKNGPVLIAANHPNSFLDAIIIACFINRPLHFLARSDVFKTKLADKILRRLNLIPIYRLQEGHSNLNKNEATFKECYKILDDNGAILIFVEGVSLTDFKLRPLKKGLARIAFGFAEKHNFTSNCAIVPIALNYDRPTKFRSKINIGLGQTQYIKDYKENFEINNNSAYGLLNEVLFKELQDHTIEVEDKNIEVYQALSELDNCFHQNSLSRKILIANNIKNIEKKSPKSLSTIKCLVEKINETLSIYRLNFRKLKVNAGLSSRKLFVVIITTPLAIISAVVNGIPFVLAKLIADKFVKLDEFYASVRCVSGTILWIIYSLVITIIAFKIHFIGILTPLFMYLLVLIYLDYYEKWKYISSSLRLRKLRLKTERFTQLQQQVKSIYRLRANEGFAPNK